MTVESGLLVVVGSERDRQTFFTLAEAHGWQLFDPALALDRLAHPGFKVAAVLLDGRLPADVLEALTCAARRRHPEPLLAHFEIAVLSEVGNPAQLPIAAQAFIQVARREVGRTGLWETKRLLVRTMLLEALERTSGSIRGAALLLGVTRQALQAAMDEHEIDRPAKKQHPG